MEILCRRLDNSVRSRLVLIAVIFLLGCANAFSQTRPAPIATPSADASVRSNNPSKDNSDFELGSPESEMRAKAMLKEEKRRYDENVGRAREVAQLASQVCESYEARKALSADDGKRLERLAKLTKRIRNEAGGSDSESDSEAKKEAPPEMPDLLKKISEMADDLQKMVEKTPRWVVSAGVIDQANKLIGLVQHVRASR